MDFETINASKGGGWRGSTRDFLKSLFVHSGGRDGGLADWGFDRYIYLQQRRQRLVIYLLIGAVVVQGLLLVGLMEIIAAHLPGVIYWWGQ